MISKAELEAWCDERDVTVMFADGFEDALVGIAQIFTTLVAIYDRERCLAILEQRDGMTHEEADEFFEFNVQGAYVGEQTPGFLIRVTDASKDS